MTDRPIDRGFALASFQRAMLGAVTPELRAVALDLSEGVHVRFVYASAVDDDIRELVDEVETEIISDFEPDATVETVIESDPDGAVTYADTEIPVFRRRET